MRLRYAPLFALAFALAGCPDADDVTDLEEVDKSTLVKVITADNAKVLDPHATSDGGNVKIMNQVYERLLRVDPDDVNKLIPILATKWSVAEDGRSIRFALREGVEFHDGTKLDGAAVKLSLDRVRKVGFKIDSPYASMYSMIDEVVDDGEYVTIKLNSASARVALRNLAMFNASIVSPKVLAKVKDMDKAEGQDHINKHPIGTGPFKVQAFDPNTNNVRLASNAKYWGGEPAVKELLFHSVPDENARIKMLEAVKEDQFVVCDDVPRHVWTTLGKRSGLELKQWWSLNVCYLGISGVHAATQELPVRRAIALAVRRDRVLDHYDGTARATFGLVAQPMGEYDPDLRVEGWDDDHDKRIERAKKLVAEAGAKGRKVTIYYPNQPRPYLPRPAKIADTIKQELRAIGLDAQTSGVDKAVLFTEIPQDKYEMILIGWTTDNGDADNFYSPLADGDDAASALNVSRILDPEIHDRLLRAQAITDGAERIKAYRAIERDLQNRVGGYVPLVNTKQALIYSKGVKGLEVDPLSSYRFHKVKLKN